MFSPNFWLGNKPVFLTFIFYIGIFSSLSQNLVYNGDFEIYNNCPSNPSFPGDLQIERCLGWTTPRKLGTADYFNECNNPINGGLAGVPQNISGFQYPLNGHGYCGIIAWALNQDNSNYREYLQTKLMKSLEGGKIYKLKFYISYSGNNYSVRKIGALLSQDSFTENTSNSILKEPQVVNVAENLIDTLNWMKIEGQFIASGNEQYLTIGYFEEDASVKDTLNTFNIEYCQNQSYYYVDGVELVEENFEFPNVFTPNSDGINDNFSIDFWAEEFYVLNRWGNIVAHIVNNHPFWNGNDQEDNPMPDGTYFYVIIAGRNKKTGFIQLMR